MSLSASAFVKNALSGNISVVEHTHKILEEVEKSNKDYSHFNVIAKDFALSEAQRIEKEIKGGKAKGRLLGVPVSVKDCLCVKGMESRGGSKILSGYVPPFDATAVAHAKAEGAIIIGKTSQDEFGFGTFGKNVGVDFPLPRNPYDKSRSCGGSSSGSGGFTALTKNTHLSICESTGGSIACPSSFCGVASVTPTYGRVSRYGLMDYASSLDKIGTMGKTVEDSALLLDVISGHDPKDSTSIKEQHSVLGHNSAKFKLAVPKDLLKEVDEKVSRPFWQMIKKAESNGFSYEEISLPLNSKYGVSTYYLIAVSEASTNLAKYCGLRYGASEPLQGTFDEYFTEVRSKNFGREAKRRIILGTFARMSGFRDAYYLKAMKARTLLINEYKKIFSKYDFVAHPTMPILAPTFDEASKLTPVQDYCMDLCTVPANLAGMPHLSLNISFVDKLPCGMMLTSDHLEEAKLIDASKKLEAIA